MKTSETFKAFIANNQYSSKVAKLLHLHLNSSHRSASLICTDALDYLTNRSDGMISFLPKGKECIYTDNGQWSRQNRQSAKPARIVNKLFSPQALRMLNGRDLEVFANLYTASFADLSNLRVEFISGAEITKVYGLKDKDNTMNGLPYSDVGGSCMQGGRASKFAIYANNPDVIGLCAVWSGEALVARCLTWNIDGSKYADRIYARTEALQEGIKLLLMESGYHVKEYQSMHHREQWITPNGERVNLQLEVKVSAVCVNEFPYMDTFCFMEGERDIATLYNHECNDYTFRLHCTDGDRQRMITTIHGDTMGESDCVWSDYHNGWIPSGDAIELDGDWYDDSEVERIDVIVTPDGVYDADDCERRDGYRLPNGVIIED